MKGAQALKRNKDRIASILIAIGLICMAIPAGFWLNSKYYQWGQSREWQSLVTSYSDDAVRTLRHGTKNTAGALKRAGEPHDGKQTAPISTEDLSGWLPELIDTSTVKAGDSIAFLEIPRLNLSFGVFEAATWANLAKGPVRVSKTARIGDKGTVLISGHRTMYGAPFHNLHNMKLSDEIVLYTKKAVFVYTVIGIKKVKPDDWSDIQAAGEPRLVLSTCEPMYSAEKRLLVLARLTGARKLRAAE